MNGFAHWLASTHASAFVQQTLWLIPVVQTLHIVCVALVFSSVVMVEFRILGVSHAQTMAETAQRYIPWIFYCVIVMALTGFVLIVGEPQRSLPSFEFQVKMAFLAVAIALTYAFATSVRRHADIWEDDSSARWMTSALAIIALLAWAAVVVYGRWIAYTVVH